MDQWGSITWDIARSGGFVAYGLLTLSVWLGLALSLHWKSERWPRLITNEMHLFTTILGLVFTLVHGVAVWIDPFTRFRWTEVLVPMLSHYRPFWMALGIVALYLGVAVGLSAVLRPKIGYAWWRRLHYLAFGVYALATAHGIATGSDTRTAWGVLIYALSVAVVLALTLTRLLSPRGLSGRPRRRYPALAASIVGIVLVGSLLTAAGPLRPGWNTIANNGNGSGAAVALDPASPSPAKTDAYSAPFTASFDGTLQTLNLGDREEIGLQLVTQLDRSPAGRLEILLRGRASRRGLALSAGQVVLGSQDAPLYQGALTQIDGERMSAVLDRVGDTSTGQLQVQIDLQTISPSGQVHGTVTVQPLAGAKA